MSASAGGAVVPARPRVRARHHVLPALVVFAAVTAVVVLALLVFSLVFLVDDEFDPKAVVLGLAGGIGAAAGVAVVAFVVGLALDALTRSAPTAVRWAAPAPLPLVGLAVMVVVDPFLGFYPTVLGMLLCAYWVVFLAQDGVVRLYRRVRARSAGS
ncbi:MAG: hypothetical protein HY830_22425 [Actinobacteria bacterium]|nr:hypothetical protein [Actinomycetota bacterium]